MLCQLDPGEVGVSSNTGTAVSRASLGRDRSSHDEGGMGNISDSDQGDGDWFYERTAVCPICKLTYKDMVHHYRKKHPERECELKLKLRRPGPRGATARSSST